MSVANSRIIILDKPFTPSSNWVWRQSWIMPYESPWGIIEKFRFVNSASEQNIIEIFSDGYKERVIKKSSKSNIRDFINMDLLNGDMLEYYLGQNIKQLNIANINKLVGILPIGPTTLYLSKVVRYCPTCIKVGHHSILHQIKLLTKCPYHLTSLESKCPHCNRNIPYQANYSWSSQPFVCKCGHSFVDSELSTSFIKKWQKDNFPELRLKEVLYWLNLNGNQQKELDKLYYYEKHIEKYADRLMSSIFSLTDRKNRSNHQIGNRIVYTSWVNIKVGPIISHDQNLIDLINIYNELQPELNECAWKIFKSLARRYRKTLLKQHKSCVKMLRYPQSERFCEYAFVYVMWRKSIEGLDNYWQVDNGSRQNTWYNNSFLMGPFIDNFILETFGALTKSCSRERIIWVYGRIIALSLIQHFTDWINITHELVERRLFDKLLPLENSNIPLFVIKFNEKETSRKASLEINWWSDDQNIFDKRLFLECSKYRNGNYNT